ncbi:hypothetical protein C8Q74DRAFT_1231913 [Fomes fomentarius]|nr:hypothetical protein C8Q74DRAFT_1231913 [Fomes fomentarius]
MSGTQNAPFAPPDNFAFSCDTYQPIIVNSNVLVWLRPGGDMLQVLPVYVDVVCHKGQVWRNRYLSRHTAEV